LRFHRKEFGWSQRLSINDHTKIIFDEPTQSYPNRHFSITFVTKEKKKEYVKQKTINLPYIKGATMIEYDGYWVEFLLAISPYDYERRRVWVRCDLRHSSVVTINDDFKIRTISTSSQQSPKYHFVSHGIIVTSWSGLCRWYHDTTDHIIDDIPVMYSSSISSQSPTVVSPSSRGSGRDLEFQFDGADLTCRKLDPIQPKVRQQFIEWLPHDMPTSIIEIILVYSWTERVLSFDSAIPWAVKSPVTWKHPTYDDIICYVQIRRTKPSWMLITMSTGTTYATRIPDSVIWHDSTIPTSTIDWPVNGVVLTCQSKQFRITLSFQLTLQNYVLNATEVIMGS
jgi:hypothetical protein